MIHDVPKWGWVSVCVVLISMVCCVPALAQRNAAAFKKGDRVEAKDGFDWKPGTVVAVEQGSWVEVRLDKTDLPDGVPKDVRERFKSRPFPPDNVRRIKGGKAAKAEAAYPLRKWTNKSGKFSVDARFDDKSGDNVVLVKKDGKQITVPLDKLSDADQEYVKGLGDTEKNPFAESAAPETADTTSNDESSESSTPKGANVNWNGAKTVRPQKFSKWSFAPAAGSAPSAPPVEGANVLVPLSDIPGSKKFFEKASGIFVAGDGSRAVIARQKGEVGGKQEQFLELVDVKENASKGLTALPLETAVLDAMPEAGLVMYRPEIFGSGKNTLLTVAQFDGNKLTTVKQFEPYAHEEWGPNRDVEKAWFLSANRAMTFNHMGKTLTVWDISAVKALLNIPVGNWANLPLAFSADRKLLAIIMKEGIAIIDLDAGRHVATIPTEGMNFNRVEFRSDNTRLAGQTWDSATVWDLTNGKKVNEFFHDSLRPSGELAWAGDYLLSQNQYLFDVGRRILLWEYTGAPEWAFASKMQAGRLWVVPKLEDGRETVLLVTPIPHATAIQEGSALPPAEALLAVKPGDEVAIEVDIDPSIQITDEVRKSLTAKANSAGGEDAKIVVIDPGRALADLVRKALAANLNEAGLKVVDSSKLVVKAVCKPQAPQQIKINMRDSGPGFGRFGGASHIEERTITPHMSTLEMTLNGEKLWKRGGVAQPNMTIWIQKDETLEQALDRLTKPNVAMFTHAKFSGYYARPGKANGNGAYGVSQISAQGVIDGKGAVGGSGAVFE